MIGLIFGRVVVPGMRAPGAGVGLPWAWARPTLHVGTPSVWATLSVQWVKLARTCGAEVGLHLALSQTRTPRGDTRRWVYPACVLGLTRTHGCRPWHDLRLMGPALRLNSLGSYVWTRYSWVLQQDSMLLGSASRPKANGSCVRTRTQPPWVWPRTQTLTLLGPTKDPTHFVRTHLVPTPLDPDTDLTSLSSDADPTPLGSGYDRPSPLRSEHGPKPLRSAPGRTQTQTRLGPDTNAPVL
jgi:hypothetical protein